jgi:hypothetical protein
MMVATPTKSPEKKTTILFGAGAAIPWGAPKTDDLTDLIRNSGERYTCVDSDKKITAFIYEWLKSKGYNNSEVNFETIINVIEDLIIYYSHHSEKLLPSFTKSFYTLKFKKKLLNFTVEYIKGNLYNVFIPNGGHYKISNYPSNNESPEQLFFQALLTEIIGNINTSIIEYSYHSKTAIKSSILQPQNDKLNNLFQRWMKSQSEGVLRLYNLNYDRLFKVLCLDAGIDIFEGFDCGEFIPDSDLQPNIVKILNDFDSNVHYNLHGCCFWEVHPRDNGTQLSAPWISLTPFPILGSSNHENAIVQIEKGKSIVITNIVTGYQKAQKSFITPFKQMQAAFDKDCLMTNDLYIIGYSFSDGHINASIKTAIKNNPNLRLILVDPAYSEADGRDGYTILVNTLINTIPEILQLDPTNLKYSNDNRSCEYYNGKLLVHSMKFEEFLALDIH